MLVGMRTYGLGRRLPDDPVPDWSLYTCSRARVQQCRVGVSRSTTFVLMDETRVFLVLGDLILVGSSKGVAKGLKCRQCEPQVQWGNIS
jgi:hypothetical protein